MGKLRFVQPDTVRLPLSHGDWIQVKKRLSVGEEREAFASVVGEVNAEGWRRPNLKMMGIAEVLAYVVDWSLRDMNDKSVPVSAAAIGQLAPEDYKEIEDAITTHAAAVEAEMAAQKNVQDGARESVAISPSAA